MKTYKRIFMGLAVLFIVGIIGAAFVGQLPGRNYLEARRVSRAVLALPLGLSKSQVEVFLQGEELGYSYIGNEKDIDFSSAVSDNGYSSANLSGYMVAIIRNTSGGLMVSSAVQYYFFFDHKGELVKATAEKIMTGP